MIRTVTCMVVICDRCNQSAGEQDDDPIGEPHFTNLDKAAKHLSGWRLDPTSGDAVCPSCILDEECATHGHDLDEWHDCDCQGRRPPHLTAMTVDAILASTCLLRVRRCQRCHHYSETDPPLPHTTEEEPEMPTTVDLDEFTAALVDGELAPAGAVTTELTPERRVAVTIELSATYPHKARWLTNWLDVLMDPIAMDVDHGDPNDNLLRLTISGSLHSFLDTAVRATITVPFSTTSEPAEAAVILAATTDYADDCGQEVTELIEQLADLDTHRKA